MRPGRRRLRDLRGVYNTVPVTFGSKVTGTQGAKVTGTREVREETEYGKNLFKQ